MDISYMITRNGDEIDTMNRKELHDFIEEKQPNICQISCYKDGVIQQIKHCLFRHIKTGLL